VKGRRIWSRIPMLRLLVTTAPARRARSRDRFVFNPTAMSLSHPPPRRQRYR
jgi:hypothetical protein